MVFETKQNAYRIPQKGWGKIAFERTILNLLQRMSGIATATANYVQEVKKKQVQIAATRKTPWGLLDKRAVCVGGGISHRLGLYDQILVKDTHLQFLKYDFEKIWQKLSQRKTSCIEIEVESEKAAIQCIEAIKTQNIKTPIILMFDNMNPEEIRSTIEKIRKIKKDISFEASGGIKNIQAYIQSGVDFISLGEITHSTKAADFSLKLG
jgi:nicotinate-nucleotide pyrophosphorylase (carboxylating)